MDTGKYNKLLERPFYCDERGTLTIAIKLPGAELFEKFLEEKLDSLIEKYPHADICIEVTI